MTVSEFRSDDDRFGLVLPASALQELRHLCEGAKALETGGILIGFYSPTGNSAVVSRVTGPPRDSAAGPTWFNRGTHELTSKLSSLWPKGEFYLGEWHYHPGGAPPVPSPQDCKQLKQIADSPQYHCPEPVLVIASIVAKEGLSLAVFVFPRREPKVGLKVRPTPPDAASASPGTRSRP
ncbi:MAG: Mov34/MPN/PAD-1 family protein [Planctomycetota bacterium]|nr:Mov34/MPN/PAD-1 family protein [Planctomycetota bacterium]